MHPVRQAVESALSDQLEPTPLRARRRVLIEEHRNTQAPDAFPDSPRQRDRIGHRGVAQRDEGHDVERADSWMNAGVPAEIDQLHGVCCERDGGIREVRRITGERQDRPMVRGVGRAVEQTDALDAADCFRERVHDRRIASLADVWNALEERHA